MSTLRPVTGGVPEVHARFRCDPTPTPLFSFLGPVALDAHIPHTLCIRVSHDCQSALPLGTYGYALILTGAYTLRPDGRGSGLGALHTLIRIRMICSLDTAVFEMDRDSSLDSQATHRQVRARVFSIRVRFALGGSIALPPIGYHAIRYVLRRSVVGLDRHIRRLLLYVKFKKKLSLDLSCGGAGREPAEGSGREGPELT